MQWEDLYDETAIFYITNTEMEQMDKPRWHQTQRVHDWRNYIPETMQKLWPKLSKESRMIAFYMAMERAHLEEWE